MADNKKPRTCRVLLVEDDRNDAFLFKRAAEDARRILHLEIELDQVDDGLAALYLVSQRDLTNRLPHAVILDLSMPRLDGIKFLRSVRNHLQLKDLPVLVLTSSSASALHEEAVRAGANQVFVKPANGVTLLRIALEMMGSHCPLPPGGLPARETSKPRR